MLIVKGITFFHPRNVISGFSVLQSLSPQVGGAWNLRLNKAQGLKVYPEETKLAMKS